MIKKLPILPVDMDVTGLVGFWYLHDDDEHFILSRPAPGGAVKYLVPKQRLAAIEPSLPVVFAAHIQFNTAVDGQSSRPPNHTTLAQTVAYLQKGLIEFVDDKGARKACLEVMDIHTKSDTQQVLINAFVVHAGYVMHDGVHIPFIESAQRETLVLEKDSLNRQYPGWWERYHVASSMDLLHDETIAYVFSSPPGVDEIPSADYLFDSLGEI